MTKKVTAQPIICCLPLVNGYARQDACIAGLVMQSVCQKTWQGKISSGEIRINLKIRGFCRNIYIAV
jgi:hypothetical protein